MPSQSASAYQTKAYQILFGLGVLGVGLLLVNSAMSGSYGVSKLILFGMAAIGIALAIDKNYVVLCPALSVYPLSIPGIPFSAAEIGAISFVSLYFIRLSMKRESVAPPCPWTWFAWPYFVWAAATYFKNPVGLAMFGSSGMGARYYIDIALGFCVLMTYSRVRLSEKQCKYMFWALVCMSLTTVVAAFFAKHAGAASDADFMETERLTEYWVEPVVFPLLLLMCRHKVADILMSPKLFATAAFLFLLVLYSGRRTFAGYVFLAPFILAILRGKERFLTFVCALAGLIVIGFVVAGQGRIYELPGSVQRALSPLPGKWDRRLENYGTKDVFRDEMIRLAKEEVARNPMFGRGGLQLSFEEVAWAHNTQSRSHGTQGMAQVGNWHNKFWGMSADFGLPAGFFWYLFAFSAVAFSWKKRFYMRQEGARSALALYYSLLLIYDLTFTMGGSATTPFARWPQFAFLVALLNGPGDGRTEALTSGTVQIRGTVR